MAWKACTAAYNILIMCALAAQGMHAQRSAAGPLVGGTGPVLSHAQSAQV